MFDTFYSPFGINIVESKDRPRYVLPEEICPGIPWPPGFRDEINKWSREFLGTTNFIPKNTIYIIENKTMITSKDVIKISTLF